MSDLHESVLSALREGKEFSIQVLVEETGLQADALRRIIVELEEKNLVHVEREKVERWVLTKTGEETIPKGSLPEQRLCEFIGAQKVDLNALKVYFSNNLQEFSAAFGLAKRSNWIQVENKNGQTIVSLMETGKKSIGNSPLWHVLQAVSHGEDLLHDSQVISELRARGLVTTKTSTNENVRITSEGMSELKKGKKESEKKQSQIGMLTPQILSSGEWKNASFKPYDVSAGVEVRFPGRIHPLRNVMKDVRHIMVQLGFEEMESPLVESAFWNMDAMFIPQDHPARDVQDTFYLPGKAVLENAELVKRVKALHEHGGKTGSKGFGYEWDPKIAMQLLLRTHTTSTTFRELAKNSQHPQKKFAIGRIFRNEAIDATHLAEFHQVEGFVMGEGLTLRHLMGIIQEFYRKLGLTKIRFKPTYNPYTEPSMEAAAFHPALGKWIELINSGMFRAESLAPFGVKVPVIAWGFGVERLALFLHEKNTLKEIMGPEVDVDFIRNYPGTTHTGGEE